MITFSVFTCNYGTIIRLQTKLLKLTLARPKLYIKNVIIFKTAIFTHWKWPSREVTRSISNLCLAITLKKPTSQYFIDKQFRDTPSIFQIDTTSRSKLIDSFPMLLESTRFAQPLLNGVMEYRLVILTYTNLFGYVVTTQSFLSFVFIVDWTENTLTAGDR